MRNRYIVFIVTVLLAGVLAGCHRNPEVAKHKYYDSGMSYMDKKQYDSAAIQFKKALQLDPKYADAHYQLGRAMLSLQRYQEGYKELSTAVQIDPNNLKARIDLGNLLWAGREYAQAEEQARYVLEREPNNPEAYRLLGSAQFAQGHTEDALASYAKEISLNPKDANAYLNRGVLEASMKNQAAAESDFKQAISIDPKNLQAYGNLAGLYMLQKDPAKAEQVFRQSVQANPDNTMAYLRLAGVLLAQQRKDDAEKVIDQLRTSQPKNPEVALSIGDYYIASRNPDAAAKEYERGLTLGGDKEKTQEIRARLVETRLETGKVKEAEELNEQMLKDNPKDVTARIMHARLLAVQGKPQEAVTALRAVVKDAPDNPQGHYMLGVVLHQTGDLNGSKTELQEAVKRQPENPLVLLALSETYRDAGEYDTAKEYASRLLKLNPNNLQAHLLMATINLGLKDYTAALDELDIVERALPNDAMVHVNKAFAYAGLKKTPDAEREFQAAIKLNPQYDAAVGDYVNMLVVEKQGAKALEVARQYAAANPNRPQALFIYGSALANNRQFDQAQLQFQKATQLDPKFMMAYVQLARIDEFIGKPDSAADAYKQALAIQPKSTQLLTMLGNLYLTKNDLTTALGYYQQALNINPNDPVAANDVAWVYALQGQNLDMALSLATQAKQAAPQMEAVNDTLAWIQYKKGNYTISVSLLEDAVKKQPESAEFRYHLGMALDKSGDKDRARTELQKALSLNLKGDDATQAQQTLAMLGH